jgi:hypothetical protein
VLAELTALRRSDVDIIICVGDKEKRELVSVERRVCDERVSSGLGRAEPAGRSRMFENTHIRK